MTEGSQQYYRFEFVPIPDEISIARLYESGFEAFEEKEHSMEGYLPASVYTEALKIKIHSIHPIQAVALIPPQNWNAIWESSFEPIYIDDTVCIRASFHQPSTLLYDIVIDPKMAFGTGHHATTYMVVSEMIKLDLKHKKVLDFGCGSGVLAILAEKSGASQIKAIDYDIWSVENSQENATLNQCYRIAVAQYDSLKSENGQYDILVANITRDVLIQNTIEVRRLLVEGGWGIYSGFLEQDLNVMRKLLQEFEFCKIHAVEKEGWCALVFSKPLPNPE